MGERGGERRENWEFKIGKGVEAANLGLAFGDLGVY
jgi:hypothetical protein